MGIKSKNKLPKSVKVLLLLFSGVVLCFLLYYLMDFTWNGTFLDWFDNNYMVSYSRGEVGDDVIIRQPDWYKVKTHFFIGLIIGILLFLGIIIAVSRFYANKKVSESVSQISQMMRSYMASEKEAADVFPAEYAQVSAQIVEIKSVMLHNEQILKDESARKNDLITYLAHDLKTPLTSIIGYLSLLDEAPDMPSPQKSKYVKITLDKAHRLEQLINEFFDITRYNLQQIRLEKETIDLYYMLVQITDEFFPILEAHSNTVRLHGDDNLEIYGDSIKLARVFNNILKNAIAYSYRETAIDILVEHTEKEVCISFCNKGKTIPQQRLETIFEKFFRLDDARTTNTGGAGLGLAIAKEIITLHDGSITATSKDELTIFTVTLPLL